MRALDPALQRKISTFSGLLKFVNHCVKSFTPGFIRLCIFALAYNVIFDIILNVF